RGAGLAPFFGRGRWRRGGQQAGRDEAAGGGDGGDARGDEGPAEQGGGGGTVELTAQPEGADMGGEAAVEQGIEADQPVRQAVAGEAPLGEGVAQHGRQVSERAVAGGGEVAPAAGARLLHGPQVQ